MTSTEANVQRCKWCVHCKATIDHDPHFGTLTSHLCTEYERIANTFARFSSYNRILIVSANEVNLCGHYKAREVKPMPLFDGETK